LLPDDDVKPRYLLASLCLALAACGHGSAPDAVQAEATGSSQQATGEQAPKKDRRLTADDIAQIKATGKTGLWADPTEICTGGKRGERATLVWNVSGQADKVEVVLVGRKGNRKFGSGGAIGQKQTGKWVRPGMNFKLLDATSHAELGSFTFAGKQCG
jgi:hypothetical protein